MQLNTISCTIKEAYNSIGIDTLPYSFILRGIHPY